MTQTTPCLLIGAGAGGVTTALWLNSYDIPYLWVSEGGRIGGILDRVHNAIDEWPGSSWPDGEALAERMRDQIEESMLLAPRDARVERLERRDGTWRAGFSGDTQIGARTVVLATGTEYRTLDVPGEQEGLGDYVSRSATRDVDRFAGRTVGMVGGGDAGFEGALQLADAGCRVHMLLRSSQFRARRPFVERVRRCPDIHIHSIPTLVERIERLADPRGCRLHLEVQGEPETMEVAALFVRIGVEPVTPPLSPEPETDEDGHLIVDRAQETTADRLLAVGDVTDTPVPSVAVAAGGGARAAHRVAEWVGYV